MTRLLAHPPLHLALFVVIALTLSVRLPAATPVVDHGRDASTACASSGPACGPRDHPLRSTSFLL